MNVFLIMPLVNTRWIYQNYTKRLKMFGLGTTEILVIAFVIVLLFGGKRLPQLGRSLGSAITNFKKGLNDSDKKEINDDDNKPS